MLLLGVVFALLTVGLVVPCVIDIATTPKHHFDLPTKQNWLIVVIAFWIFGAGGLAAARPPGRADASALE